MTTEAQLLVRRCTDRNDPDELQFGMTPVFLPLLTSCLHYNVPNPCVYHVVEQEYQNFVNVVQLGENLRLDMVRLAFLPFQVELRAKLTRNHFHADEEVRRSWHYAG